MPRPRATTRAPFSPSLFKPKRLHQVQLLSHPPEPPIDARSTIGRHQLQPTHTERNERYEFSHLDCRARTRTDGPPTLAATRLPLQQRPSCRDRHQRPARPTTTLDGEHAPLRGAATTTPRTLPVPAVPTRPLTPLDDLQPEEGPFYYRAPGGASTISPVSGFSNPSPIASTSSR